MKKRLFIAAVMVLCIAAAFTTSLLQKAEPAKIIVATDTHYLSSALNDGGKAFYDILDKSDGKMVQYCEEIFSAFSDEVIEAKPDVLILSGDLTFNGEKQSHYAFAERLKKIQDSGTQVLVIPGNHDIESKAFSFEGSEFKPTDSISAEEFKSIYADFGTNQAESIDTSSLSYIYKVNKGLYVLMLDTNAYGKNFVQDESYEWIKTQLEMVKRNRARVITVSHQNLFAHNEQLSFGYQLYDAAELLELYNSYKVKCNLSGHIHMQHIKTDGICEITTSSLLVAPVQYGCIDFNGSISYKTKCVDVAEWASENGISNPDLLDFSAYANEFFKQNGKRAADKALSDSNLTEQEKRLITDTLSQLNADYFAGRKTDREALKEGIELLEKQDGFLSKYTKLITAEADNDYNTIVIN